MIIFEGRSHARLCRVMSQVFTTCESKSNEDTKTSRNALEKSVMGFCILKHLNLKIEGKTVAVKQNVSTVSPPPNTSM